MHSKFRVYSVSIAFIVCSALPFVNDRLKLFKDIASFENRLPAQEPFFDVRHLDVYPQPYEKFYNDHFLMRSLLIKLHSYFEILFFHVSPIPKDVMIGSDGWLFSSSQELDSYLGRNGFTPAELESIKLELEYRRAYLQKRNCRLYLLIAPGKANIYSEYVPARYISVNKQNWGEQLINYLAKNSNVTCINVYDVLRAKASGVPTYYKLDNHWNNLGGFYSTQEAIRVMRKDFPSLQLPDLADFELSKEEHNQGNMQKMMGDLELFADFTIKLEPKKGYKAKVVDKVSYPPPPGFAYPWEYELNKETGDSTKPNLLVISDSFGAAVFTYLAESFNRSVRIFDAWQYKLNENIVENEKPDAVLVVVNEPIVKELLKNQANPGKK